LLVKYAINTEWSNQGSAIYNKRLLLVEIFTWFNHNLTFLIVTQFL